MKRLFKATVGGPNLNPHGAIDPRASPEDPDPKYYRIRIAKNRILVQRRTRLVPITIHPRLLDLHEAVDRIYELMLHREQADKLRKITRYLNGEPGYRFSESLDYLKDVFSVIGDVIDSAREDLEQHDRDGYRYDNPRSFFIRLVDEVYDGIT